MNKHKTENIYLFIIFMSVLFSYAQNGTVTYKITFNEQNDITPQSIKEEMNTLDKNLLDVSCVLKWNEDTLRFGIENFKSINQDDFNTILQFCDSEGIYYKKKGSNEVYREIPAGNRYQSVLCNRKYLTLWRYLDEKKTIAGYECLKADCILAIDYGDGELQYTYPITAWYYPNEKYQFGPRGIEINGLILELVQNFVTLTAVNVELSFKNYKVEFPSNKKIIPEFNLSNFIENSQNQ